jgi:hypothetical protein
MITEAGLNSAEELVTAYASKITMVQFCDAWDWAWSQLGRQWPSIKEGAKSKALPDSGGSMRDIPLAPVAPEEWQW